MGVLTTTGRAEKSGRTRDNIILVYIASSVLETGIGIYNNIIFSPRRSVLSILHAAAATAARLYTTLSHRLFPSFSSVHTLIFPYLLRFVPCHRTPHTVLDITSPVPFPQTNRVEKPRPPEFTGFSLLFSFVYPYLRRRIFRAGDILSPCLVISAHVSRGASHYYWTYDIIYTMPYTWDCKWCT